MQRQQTLVSVPNCACRTSTSFHDDSDPWLIDLDPADSYSVGVYSKVCLLRYHMFCFHTHQY